MPEDQTSSLANRIVAPIYHPGQIFSRTRDIVGVSLLAIAVGQSDDLLLTHRYREQAKAYIEWLADARPYILHACLKD